MNSINTYKKTLAIFAMLLGLAVNGLAFETSSQPLHQIPFKYEVDKILIPISVNGSKPLRGVLDTGMPGGVFIPDPNTAKDMGFEYIADSVPIGGAGANTQTASVATGAIVDFGGVKFDKQRAIVINKASQIGRFGFDVVMGASVFNKYVVQIDVANKIIKLYDPKTFDNKGIGEGLDLTITRTKPFIKMLVDVDGKKAVPLNIVVDTGAGTSLMLPDSAEKGVVAPKNAITGVLGAGVGGDLIAKAGRVKSIQMGQSKLSNVMAQFGDNSAPAGGDGLMGMRIMKRFLVTFDYSKKKMYIKPNADFKKPFEFTMIGIVARPQADGATKVTELFPGSAAAMAGVKKGDLIDSINGKKVDYRGWSIFHSEMENPGTKITLGVIRDGKPLNIELVTKRQL